MKRRTFVSGLAASLALGTKVASAQRTSSATSAVATSEFTGATIDFSGSNLELMQLHVDEADGVEHAHFQSADGDQFDINFFPTEHGDSADYASAAYRMWAATMPNSVELIDEQTLPDGGWLICEYEETLAYYEYQYGSYPNHDLVIALEVEKSTFLDVFDQAQMVMVDGLPPMLFDTDSAILDIADEVAAGVSTTTRTSTSRSTRSGSNSSSTTEQAATSTGGGAGAVADVIAHRVQFWESYDEFYANLEIAGDEATDDTASAVALTAMANISLEWQAYPTTAAEVIFSPEEADLESMYLAWADLVGEMGVSFEQFFMGNVPIDEFIALVGEFQLVDTDLATMLDGFGSIGNNKKRATHRTQKQLQILGKPLQHV